MKAPRRLLIPARAIQVQRTAADTYDPCLTSYCPIVTIVLHLAEKCRLQCFIN